MATRFYNIDQIIAKAKAEGYRGWSDEKSVIRGLDCFAIIFLAKYSGYSNGFTFYYEKEGTRDYIFAVNVSEFGYRFPLAK